MSAAERSERQAQATLLLRIEADNQAWNDRMEAELNAAKCDGFPGPDQLGEPGGVAAQKQIVDTCRRILSRQREEAQGQFAKATGWIDAANFPPALRREVRAGFEQTAAASRQHVEWAFATTARIYELEGDLLDFLERERGHWAAQAGTLGFDSDALIDEYRRRIQAMQSIGEELEADMKAQEDIRRRLNAAVRTIDPDARPNAPVEIVSPPAP
ncbi:MAG TPA: hypothetical protein VG939_01860 [Caulobacteraceae bacterium]|nr:hypothetical protein [Caulobacteraceae bacterium]